MTTPVSLTDIAPTLLELAGVAGLAGPDGRSLLGTIADPVDQPVIMQVPGYAIAIRLGRFKYIEYDPASGRAPELYDLAADPGELQPSNGRHPADERRLRLALDDWTDHAPPAIRHRPDSAALPPNQREQLSRLGYIQ